LHNYATATEEIVSYDLLLFGYVPLYFIQNII